MKSHGARWLSVLLLVSTLPAPLASRAADTTIPTVTEAFAAKRDLFGEAAMRQPNGPSYEFFAPILPPPRYVNADFRYYPIVLSAPNAHVKARLISNGSGVNLRGGSASWNDNGTPVRFRVGPDRFEFGGLASRVSLPALVEGWLPITQIEYVHPSPYQSGGLVPIDQKPSDPVPEKYRLEAFASTDPALAQEAVVFVKFSLVQGTNGFIAAEVEGKHLASLAAGVATNSEGGKLALFDAAWKTNAGMMTARLKAGDAVYLVVATKPLEVGSKLVVSAAEYEKQREMCISTWRKIIAAGMNVETPEPYVNDAWRHLICQNFELINGDRIHYSAGNQYEKLYESEGSDAALAMLVWGYDNDMRRLLVPLMDFTRKGLEYHQAGFKLIDLCRYYWQTRDANVVKELRPQWEKEARRLDENRTGAHGLYPEEQYCGDIETFVQSMNVASKAWRAMRDLSAVLEAVGEAKEAKYYADQAAAFRKTVQQAILESARHDTTPPFVPVALYGNEPVHDPIWEVRIGTYWNIIIGYTIGSGIFPPGSQEENWIPNYQEQHGGLFMGMLRGAAGPFTFWNGKQRINPLYGTRYAMDTLRRDDAERALVSFYGMLAQGFTRNTFICGEGCTLDPVDEGGRFFYLPPNSAANAHFLSMLRGLLVQDWDLDDDGRPETLRLAFATPRRWLEDGKSIKVERAPTAFGPVAMKFESHLSRGEVTAEVDLPERDKPGHIFLRARVPDGWKVTGATVGADHLVADERGTIDLSKMRGHVSVRFQTEKR